MRAVHRDPPQCLSSHRPLSSALRSTLSWLFYLLSVSLLYFFKKPSTYYHELYSAGSRVRPWKLRGSATFSLVLSGRASKCPPHSSAFCCLKTLHHCLQVRFTLLSTASFMLNAKLLSGSPPSQEVRGWRVLIAPNSLPPRTSPLLDPSLRFRSFYEQQGLSSLNDSNLDGLMFFSSS